MPVVAKEIVTTMDELPKVDAQTRALYRFLLERVSNFHEFKRLVTLYPAALPGSGEPAFAAQIRALLRSRISQWLGTQVDALSADELLCWRAIVVEETFGKMLWFKGYGTC
jgi:hypothetical protein